MPHSHDCHHMSCVKKCYPSSSMAPTRLPAYPHLLTRRCCLSSKPPLCNASVITLSKLREYMQTFFALMMRWHNYPIQVRSQGLTFSQALGFNAVRLLTSFASVFGVPPVSQARECASVTPSDYQAYLTNPATPVAEGATIPNLAVCSRLKGSRMCPQ